MTYELYGDRRSGSAAVEMALAEIGAPFELHTVSIDRNEQLAPDYLRINPMGRVPALRLPDGLLLTESVAILLALDERHPGAGLLPPPASGDRARAMRWMLMMAGEYYPAVTRSDYPERFSTDPSHAGAIRESARAQARAFWELIERHAQPAPYLLGAQFSAADLYASVLSQWMGNAAWVTEHCPGVAALIRAVASRPKAGPVWRSHFGA